MRLFRWIVFVFAVLSSVVSLGDETSSSSEKPVTSPWMTGPLLAPGGHTLTPGVINLEPYLFYTDDFGFYNSHWHRVSAANTDKLNPQLMATYGVNDWMDLAVGLPYLFQYHEGQSDNGFGDVKFTVGFQAVNAVPHTWIPDVRFTVSEVFPTGDYENLNSARRQTDAFGAGSYQTAFSMNLQKMWYLANHRFLRGRLAFSYNLPASVDVHGFNTYGGAVDTNATMHLGNGFTTDLGFEYTVTRHWVPAIDFVYQARARDRVTGFVGTTTLGLPAIMAAGSSSGLSIAPAIEYNFNADLGVIAGVWFRAFGRNTSDFVSGVVAVNYAF